MHDPLQVLALTHQSKKDPVQSVGLSTVHQDSAILYQVPGQEEQAPLIWNQLQKQTVNQSVLHPLPAEG